MTAGETVFAKILRKEIPARILHEDDRCVAFHDAAPTAPFHALVVPRKALVNVADAASEDAALLGHLLLTGAAIARAAGCGEAFRLVVNNGAGAGQSVFHLHVHVIGGRKMTWPPG
jgi:histidine triad (HIT) family protein